MIEEIETRTIKQKSVNSMIWGDDARFVRAKTPFSVAERARGYLNDTNPA